MNTPLGDGGGLSDAPRCIVCGAEYEYDFHTYAHLGGFRCPKCGYSRTEPDVAVVGVDALNADGSAAEFRVDGEIYPAAVSLPAVYNLYNAAAALTAARAMGAAPETAVKSLAHIERGFGRMENFELGSARITMILVKNPAGCDRAIEYLASQSFNAAAFCLNDGTADGTDVSWIWDANFERIFLRREPRSEDAHRLRHEGGGHAPAPQVRRRRRELRPRDTRRARARRRARRGGAGRSASSRPTQPCFRCARSSPPRGQKGVLEVMELKICHLYPDVLNLYGDRGNVLAMKKRLEWRGIGCTVDEIPIGERLPLSKFDLFFIGGGQDFEQGLLLDDLRSGKGEDIRSAVEDGLTFLTVCGGYQLITRDLVSHTGEKLPLPRRARSLHRRRRGTAHRQLRL